jgi:ATP-binding cassette subfamily B multidrug efflux pump
MALPPPNEDILMKGYDPEVTRRLVAFGKPYARTMLISLALMVVSSAAAVAGPYLVKMALDEGVRAGSLPVLRQTVLLYLLATILQWASIYIRVNIMARAGQSIIFDLRARLFEHLQRLSLAFYSHYSVGRVITRVINDVSVLRDFITWALLAVARDLFTLVGILIVMIGMNLRLSLLTFTVIPLMILATIAFRKQARDNYRLVRAAISWVNSVLAENINGVRVVQAFSRQAINYQRFCGEVNQNNLQTNLKAARIAAAYPAVIDFLGSLATTLVVWLGGTAVLGPDLGGGDPITPGVLVAFVLYIDRFFEPIRDLSRRYDSFQSTMAGGERIFTLMDTPVEVQDAPGAIDLPPLRGEVRFENVSFRYADRSPQPGAPGKDGRGNGEEVAIAPAPVLEGVNLFVPAGQTVALVGETGAGKSTIVKLLSRFHDPTEGRVLVDGYDLRQVTQSSLRRQMGIVLQDPFLFNGTIQENIRFGCLEASDAEVQAAAEAVGAHEFILRQRHGYATSVEEGGALLSVGQRQLLSFARALLANPRILILDEATSSVDTQTERLIQQALAHLLQGRTAFVIAHRLSTVVNADQIVVVRAGRIVEQGSHAELLARRGPYFELYSLGFED